MARRIGIIDDHGTRQVRDADIDAAVGADLAVQADAPQVTGV